MVPTTVPYCCQFLTGCLLLFFCNLQISCLFSALKDNTNQREQEESQRHQVQTVDMIPVILKGQRKHFSLKLLFFLAKLGQ